MKRLLTLVLVALLSFSCVCQEPVPVAKTVKASYYHQKFTGRKTANGQKYNPRAMTTAHRTLPFGTKLRVTNKRNGKSCVVVVNDRGPWIKGRGLDLSYAAAQCLGMVQAGTAMVTMEVVRE